MKHITNAVQTNWKNTKNGLSKVEGIITSALELKEPRNNNPYYYAFFQLEGLDQDIPVIFKLATPCIDCENAKTICQALRGKHSKSKCEECREPHTEDCLIENKPNIPLRAKVLLEGK